MNYLHSFLYSFFLIFSTNGWALNISSKELLIIGEKIWENECAKKIELLTHWNVGEEFGSFGIGHFIWSPIDQKKYFQESFPLLLTFLQEHGVHLPFWLIEAKGCPWHSREEFYKNIRSPKMIELRKILLDTKDLQAIFIGSQLEKAMPELFDNLPEPERLLVSTNYRRLASDLRGLYALIDYSNFKGLGKESDQEGGWGLLQVLLKISADSETPLQDFIITAKRLLAERVQNAPPERHEERWLKGWFNRIDTYSFDIP